MDNATIADMLREAATLLAAQKANPFRVAGYRKAADTIAGLPTSVLRLFKDQGRAGLDALPAIGTGIAGAIAEILVSGRWSQLDRLRGGTDARHLFASIPGIGATLSERIHDEIGVDTLEALEAAAHDGRLAQVRGVGPRRASATRAVLAQRLARARVARSAVASASMAGEPPVDVLVVYFYDGDHVERQHTVVMETHGPLIGRRVVRGRERACREWYEHPAAA